MSYECFCDYDGPSVYNKTEPVARKEHRCLECRRTILPGQKYEYVWGIWNGIADTFKTCAKCVSVREYVKAHVPCFCWAHGNLSEDIANTIDAYPEIGFGGVRRYIEAFRWRDLKRRAGSMSKGVQA